MKVHYRWHGAAACGAGKGFDRDRIRNAPELTDQTKAVTCASCQAWFRRLGRRKLIGKKHW